MGLDNSYADTKVSFFGMIKSFAELMKLETLCYDFEGDDEYWDLSERISKIGSNFYQTKKEIKEAIEIIKKKRGMRL